MKLHWVRPLQLSASDTTQGTTQLGPNRSPTIPRNSAANLGGLPHRRGFVELTRVELVTCCPPSPQRQSVASGSWVDSPP